MLPERDQCREQRAKGVSQDEEAVQQTFSVDGGAGQCGLSQREAQQLVQHSEERAHVRQ